MRFSRTHARWALDIVVALMLLPLLALAEPSPQPSPASGRGSVQSVPRAALRYQRDLVRNARLVWGMDAPVAVLAAQVHQESRWNKDAQSAFAGGLAQFTPATAEWISGAYPKALSDNQPFNPTWALRALVTYDKLLYDKAASDTPCDKAWKMLWAYNGGAGWVARDEKLAAKSGANPRIALEVEPFNAGRAAVFFKENRDYPRAILIKWQPVYSGWGKGVVCG